MRFLLGVGASKIPGECEFISLFPNPVVIVICPHTDTGVKVEVLDTPASSLPEVCLTLPTGEMVDFLGQVGHLSLPAPMYGETIELPREIAQDEAASVYATILSWSTRKVDGVPDCLSLTAINIGDHARPPQVKSLFA